jgi:hypothetical protein
MRSLHILTAVIGHLAAEKCIEKVLACRPRGSPSNFSKDQTGEQDAAVSVLRQRAPGFEFPPLARCHQRRKSLQSLFACRRPPPLRTPAGSQKNLTSPAQPYCPENFPAGAACLRLLINMRIPRTISTTTFSDCGTSRFDSSFESMRVIIARAVPFLALSCFLATLLPPVHQCRVPHSRDPRELRPGHPAALMLGEHRFKFLRRCPHTTDFIPLSKSLNHSSDINRLEPNCRLDNWLP